MKKHLCFIGVLLLLFNISGCARDSWTDKLERDDIISPLVGEDSAQEYWKSLFDPEARIANELSAYTKEIDMANSMGQSR